jgi:hypothetical protein
MAGLKILLGVGFSLPHFFDVALVFIFFEFALVFIIFDVARIF